MKKVLITLAAVFGFNLQGFACADYSEDYTYYNLFNQSIVHSPEYQPFLMIMDSPFYDTSDVNIKDEKIEDWSKYLGIDYEDAYYLVYKTTKSSIDQLVKSGKTSDSKLKFANADFIKKHKQSLLYLSYAKYLEPYMNHNYIDTGDSWSYVDRSGKNASQLDNLKVMNVLERSYKAESDPALKMRYAYQMVRFAHYSNQYIEAINLFNKYVVPLNQKSVMYYYALDQKAGAERAVGNFIQANYDFFEVFSHTKNRKESAFNSMKVTQDLDYEQLLKNAKTNQEKIDLYLLIGYKDFNNPLAAMRQILKLDANAEQAKVLYARAINLVERHYLNQYANGSNWSESNIKPMKLPALSQYDYGSDLPANFILEAISLGKEQANKTNEKDFWNLSVAYLSTLNKDFKEANSYLSKVNSKQSDFVLHKKMIEMLIDLNQQDKITPAFERTIMTKYGDILMSELVYPAEYEYGEKIFTDEQLLKDRFKDVAKDILANRYFLQGDKAKAFLLHNTIYDLASNVNWDLLNSIDEFDKKSNKNSFEQYLVSNINFFQYNSTTYQSTYQKSKFKLADFIANYKGTLYLKERKFDLAKAEFKKLPQDFKFEEVGYYSDEDTNPYNWYSHISNGVFGYNRIECFTCSEIQVIAKPYVNEFNFIPKEMNKLQLTDILIQLSDLAKKNDEKGVKANYLLANFYYNTTSLGYFRELLSFDRNNWNGPKFHNFIEAKDENKAGNLIFVNYYKNYTMNAQYINNFDLSLDYAKAALAKVKDSELKANILFTAAKADQGKFYTYASNYLTDDSWYVPYDEPKFIAYKVKNHRTYFNQLKSLTNTKVYKEVKSNCKYFDTYVNL
ncbi:MAG: hypothetical protein KIG88_02770 [Weeksellaceae bacterium]|nr:hypothetical protein [Weeksellaceae bacterium]